MTSLDLQSVKIELAQIILNSEDSEMIQRIKNLIKGEQKDFWLALSDKQKEEIEISREQVRKGETEDWETLRKTL